MYLAVVADVVGTGIAETVICAYAMLPGKLP